jgi:hypothetical protein
LIESRAFCVGTEEIPEITKSPIIRAKGHNRLCFLRPFDANHLENNDLHCVCKMAEIEAIQLPLWRRETRWAVDCIAHRQFSRSPFKSESVASNLGELHLGIPINLIWLERERESFPVGVHRKLCVTPRTEMTSLHLGELSDQRWIRHAPVSAQQTSDNRTSRKSESRPEPWSRPVLGKSQRVSGKIAQVCPYKEQPPDPRTNTMMIPTSSMSIRNVINPAAHLIGPRQNHRCRSRRCGFFVLTQKRQNGMGDVPSRNSIAHQSRAHRHRAGR